MIHVHAEVEKNIKSAVERLPKLKTVQNRAASCYYIRLKIRNMKAVLIPRIRIRKNLVSCNNYVRRSFKLSANFSCLYNKYLA
jgi:hypothetical protein